MKAQFKGGALSVILHCLFVLTLTSLSAHLEAPPPPIKMDLMILPTPDLPEPVEEEEPAPGPPAVAPAAPASPAPAVEAPHPKPPPKKPVLKKQVAKPKVEKPKPVPKPKPEKPKPISKPKPVTKPKPEKPTYRVVREQSAVGRASQTATDSSARTVSLSVGTATGATQGLARYSTGRGTGAGTGRGTGSGAQRGTATGQGTGKSVYKPGEIDGKLQVLKKTPPEYPASARRRNIEGWVKVQFIVNTHGQPEQIRVVSAEPRGVFDANALRAISQWRFRPGQVQGRAVRVLVQQTIRFQLR